jgi:hypothetical protein
VDLKWKADPTARIRIDLPSVRRDMTEAVEREAKKSTTLGYGPKAAMQAELEEIRRRVIMTQPQVVVLMERVKAMTNEEASAILDFMFKDLDKMDARNPRLVLFHLLQCVAAAYGLVPPFKK